MTYDRIFNSTYAKYKRAAGPRVNFTVPSQRRANFAGFPSMQDMFVAGGGIVDGAKNAVQGVGNAFGNAGNAIGNAVGGAADYLQSPGPSAGISGIKNAIGGAIDDGSAMLGSAGDAIKGTIGSAGNMLMNGEFDPAEMAAAGVAGAGALGAGALGLARRGGEELPQGLRARAAGALGNLSTGQKAGLGALGAAGVGGAAMGANALMRDDEEMYS